MELTLKQKQDKAKRNQKVLAACLASLVVIFTYSTFPYNVVWLTLAMVYAAVVICVILAELIDEAWVTARFRECMNSAPEEPEQITIDVIL